MTWPATCQTALKEWAAICRALACGRQTILLRKGGLAEAREGFQVPQRHFWFYPTHFHEVHQGVLTVAPEADRCEPAASSCAPGISGRTASDAVPAEPAPGCVPIQLLGEVHQALELTTEAQALSLAGWHLWTETTIRQRFHYRRPGLWLIVVRVYRRPQPFQVIESAAMAGCKSWVDLPQALPTTDLLPVLDETAFHQIVTAVHTALGLTAP